MFLPYDKIEERWEGDAEAERQLSRERWVVTEKLHGANFVVVAEPGEPLRFAKRKELLAAGESFFGHEVLVARLDQEFARTVELTRATVGAEATILIYGELFGGHYPHARVPPVAELSPVQTGVWYSPRLEFCAFDLAAVVDGTRTLLPYDEALTLFHEAKLFAAEPLLIGPFSAAIKFPIERTTTIPARLGLPALAEPNLAEGVVIKTLRPVRLGDGTTVRPVLKRKLAAFAEDERYRGAEKPAGSPQHSGEALGLLLERVGDLLTPARLAAAISKIGAIHDEARRRQIVALVRDELLEELARREPAAMAKLTPPDRTLLIAQIELQVHDLLPGDR